MYKEKQTVIYELDSDNRATYRNQRVEIVEVLDDGMVEGLWNGKHVATWSLMCDEWHRI